MKIRKVMLLIVLVVLLSSCKVSKFDGGSDELESFSEIESIFETMMDKSKHDDTTMVPSDKVKVFITYNDGDIKVTDVYYHVISSFDSEIINMKGTKCSSVEGELDCDIYDTSTSGGVEEEVYLVDTISRFKRIDIGWFLENIADKYNINMNEEIVIILGYEHFEEDTINLVLQMMKCSTWYIILFMMEKRESLQ